ncbi:MAG: hypothetical protein LKJ47_04910 [Bifidobacteriaceae bacterium]|jgi:hypothetical protein|nr:hypothetical protein [Bifidobacteriaceae bacterium]
MKLLEKLLRRSEKTLRCCEYEYLEPVFGWWGWCVECGKQDDLNEHNQCRDCWEDENGNEWL